MQRPHTHYDNLKVSQHAPFEVIKAAYRALAQKYHPDVNRSQGAERLMQIINEAYSVLSDPVARKKHDDWIEEQLKSEAPTGDSRDSDHKSTRQKEAKTPQSDDAAIVQPQRTSSRFERSLLGRPGNRRVMLGLILVAAVAFPLGAAKLWKSANTSAQPKGAENRWDEAIEKVVSSPHSSPSQDPYSPPTSTVKPPNRQSPLAAQPTTASEANPSAPNGRPWPLNATYLAGMPRTATGGLSTLTIDNTDGGSDVYIKLCPVNPGRCSGLRHAFVPQGVAFTMSDIAPGSYEIRYRALDTGRLARSEPLQLSQVKNEEGTKYSKVRLTLYKVRNGNTTFSPLSEEGF